MIRLKYHTFAALSLGLISLSPFSRLDNRGWGSSENTHKPIVCDQTVTLNKGTHKIQMRHRGRGYHLILYGGNRERSTILIEEIVADPTLSNL